MLVPPLYDYEIEIGKKNNKKEVVSILENTGPKVFKFTIRCFEILRGENYLEKLNVGKRKK